MSGLFLGCEGPTSISETDGENDRLIWKIDIWYFSLMDVVYPLGSWESSHE